MALYKTSLDRGGILRVGRARTVYLLCTFVLLVLCVLAVQIYTDFLHRYSYNRKNINWGNQTEQSDNIEVNWTQTTRKVQVVHVNTLTDFLHKKPISIQGKRSLASTDQRHIVVKMSNVNIYLYTAIGVYYSKRVYASGKVYNQYQGGSRSNSSSYNTIVLNGWEDMLIKDTNFTCCIQLSNGTLMSSTSNNKRNWYFLGMAKYQAKQYVCSFSFQHSLIQLVSIVPLHDKCIFNASSYVKPVFPPNAKSKGIAVCTKLAYGSLDPGRVLEWMEVHRYLGVKKVLVYPFNLNPKITEVLQYYEKLGFVQLIDFDFPEKEKVRRNVGGRNIRSWNDEQVALFDCQERLSTYKYVAVIDTDEYLMTEKNMSQNAWLTFLDTMLENPNLAGVGFQSKIHITDWGPTTNKSSLFIGQYLNCTATVLDRPKKIYMPSRVLPGSVSTHSLFGLPGYYLESLFQPDVAIHHFRSCRPEWRRGKSHLHTLENRPYLRKYKSDDLLEDFHRYPSQPIESMAKIVESYIQRLKLRFRVT